MRLLIVPILLGLAFPALADRSVSHSANGSVTRRFDARDAAKALPVIPRARAVEIALQQVPGKVVGAEIETNDGIRTWQVDVRAMADRTVRLWLNANSGAVLRRTDR